MMLCQDRLGTDANRALRLYENVLTCAHITSHHSTFGGFVSTQSFATTTCWRYVRKANTDGAVACFACLLRK
jgi:hypothetical protein